MTNNTRRTIALLNAALLIPAWTGRLMAQHSEPGHGDVGHAAASAEKPSAGHGEASHGEAGHGDEHDKPALLHWDVGSAFWSIIVFLILLIILRAAAWKPILAALQMREKFINDSLETAKLERERTEKMLKDFDEKARQARKEASDTVEEALRDAEALRKRIHEDAQREAGEMISRAQRDIKLAQEKAVASIYHESVEIAANLAGKIVRKQLNPTDHRALLDESLAEIGKLKP